ncbi:class I SAM-dependent methyltransferase [Microvirga terrae]|uniref:Class I SAM-dependent methyltransferase n=1 Tax=Microvirga terrae TaxID=2740529 RepID=A0ABY5RXF4_9HYPH|nr:MULTISPECIES: class I SAM-dependent methyltransferase [Microvirga]MBQ0821413.1 class I SAM-dependent methyltransferase [Microvirga sp. HBU67558]UVF21703.1 class I SAM-dependent methyltransferase [Microvirga terrae]
MTATAPTELEKTYRQIAEYYSRRLRRFGPTPFGVDWSCVPTQALRFRKLLKICDFDRPISINDVGCGYGALLGYMALYHSGGTVDYLGVDVSLAMVRRARKLWSGGMIRFYHGWESPRSADYSIASGIFNVMLDQPRPRWENFIERTLVHLGATSRKAFAVNFVHEPEQGREATPGLYCASPAQWIDFCEVRLGAEVSLIEGYGMSEFTLLVSPKGSASNL